MNKSNNTNQTEEPNQYIDAVDRSIGVIINILQALDQLSVVAENEDFFHLDDLYTESLDCIKDNINKVPTEIAVDLWVAVDLLPGSLYKQQEIESRSGNILTLLLSSRSKIRQYYTKEGLSIDKHHTDRWAEGDKAIERYVVTMQKSIGGRMSEDTLKAMDHLNSVAPAESKLSECEPGLMLSDNIISIDNIKVVLTKNTKQLEFAKCFFTAKGKPKSKRVMAGDIIEKVYSYSESPKQKYHRLFSLRSNLNDKYKISTGASINLIEYENKEFYINRSLLE